MSPKDVVYLGNVDILGLGHGPHDMGEAGRQHAAVEEEGAGQLEAGLQQREQLEGGNRQQEGQGAGQPLHMWRDGEISRKLKTSIFITLQNALCSAG